MKRLALAISILAISAVGASAADMAPAPVYTKAPPPVVAIYDWSGFYIGGNGGGGWAHKCWDRNTGLGGVFLAAEGCNDPSGGVAGGQVGYRWQRDHWVFGVEAQGDWANLKGSNTSAIGVLAGVPYLNQTKIDAIGLFTGQVGYAWNNVLFYAKGGVALTDNKYNGVFTGFAFDQASQTRWGGAVGAGIEFGFAPNWSVAAEYDHLFMGSSGVTFAAAPLLGIGFTRTDSIKQNVDMGTVRVNYTFGGPVVARY
jgi:outer membrane immunogenic protein